MLVLAAYFIFPLGKTISETSSLKAIDFFPSESPTEGYTITNRPTSPSFDTN